MMALDVLSLIEGLRGPIAQLGIASPNQFSQAIAQARYDLEGGECYLPFYLAYGQWMY